VTEAETKKATTEAEVGSNTSTKETWTEETT
jgi:hypothetical protein